MPVVAAIVCFTALACSPERVKVIDGDTISIRGENIRVLGINAPELRGQCREEKVRALRARSRLTSLLKDSNVVIDRDGFDRYRRTLASVSVSGVPVGEILRREGLARKWVQEYRGQEEPWCQSDVGAALRTWNRGRQ